MDLRNGNAHFAYRTSFAAAMIENESDAAIRHDASTPNFEPVPFALLETEACFADTERP